MLQRERERCVKYRCGKDQKSGAKIQEGINQNHICVVGGKSAITK